MLAGAVFVGSLGASAPAFAISDETDLQNAITAATGTPGVQIVTVTGNIALTDALPDVTDAFAVDGGVSLSGATGAAGAGHDGTTGDAGAAGSSSLTFSGAGASLVNAAGGIIQGGTGGTGRALTGADAQADISATAMDGTVALAGQIGIAAGDSFDITANGVTRTITIGAGETLEDIANKIEAAFAPGQISASATQTGTNDTLTISQGGDVIDTLTLQNNNNTPLTAMAFLGPFPSTINPLFENGGAAGNGGAAAILDATTTGTFVNDGTIRGGAGGAGARSIARNGANGDSGDGGAGAVFQVGSAANVQSSGAVQGGAGADGIGLDPADRGSDTSSTLGIDGTAALAGHAGIAAGDSFDITINGVTETITINAGETLSDIADEINDLRNADGTFSAIMISATATGTNDTLTFSQDADFIDNFVITNNNNTPLTALGLTGPFPATITLSPSVPHYNGSDAGDGGTAVLFDAGSGGAFENTGTITGGDGGDGGLGASGGAVLGTGGDGGDGGAGVTALNGSTAVFANYGTVQGGNGGIGKAAGVRGTAGADGAGGAGILITGDGITVINGGSVAGGFDGSGAVRANAVTINGDNNQLELHTGFSFTGGVVATGTDNALALGGTGTGTFDNGTIGAAFQGFDTFEKTGSGTWTLTGTDALNWTVAGGVLEVNGTIGSADVTGGRLNLNGTVGAVTVSGGAWRRRHLRQCGCCFRRHALTR